MWKVLSMKASTLTFQRERKAAEASGGRVAGTEGMMNWVELREGGLEAKGQG